MTWVKKPQLSKDAEEHVSHVRFLIKKKEMKLYKKNTVGGGKTACLSKEKNTKKNSKTVDETPSHV